MEVHIETDHKPLVPIMMSKPLDNLTPRLQRMKLRMMRYSYTIKYTPGKKLIIADTLSRSPLPEKRKEELSKEITAYVQMGVENFLSSDARLAEIWSLQKDDPVRKLLIKFSIDGWPDKNEVPEECLKYWAYRHSISVQDDLLMKDSRIIISSKLREEILNRIHDGHLRITKYRARAHESVWWPGLSAEIQNLVSKCHKCIQHQRYFKEPLLPSAFPNRPWQTVGADLLKVSGNWYLIMADYYSRYIEVANLDSLSSEAFINHIKSIFDRHGIPEVVRSDNGPQFSHAVIDFKYRKFANQYKFSIVTSSPKHAQSNGFIESMVKSFKLHFIKAEKDDPYFMLLALRAMALENGHSPAELLMGRCLRTPIPTLSVKLKPRALDEESLLKKEEERISMQKFYFDRQHQVGQLPQLNIGEQVWVSDMRTYGKIKAAHQAPRSYIIETPRGVLRRNRRYLHPSPVPKSFSWDSEDTPMNKDSAPDSTVGYGSSQEKDSTSNPVAITHPPSGVPDIIPYKTRSEGPQQEERKKMLHYAKEVAATKVYLDTPEWVSSPPWTLAFSQIESLVGTDESICSSRSTTTVQKRLPNVEPVFSIGTYTRISLNGGSSPGAFSVDCSSPKSAFSTSGSRKASSAS
ncbi:uncharacterized protein LOC129230315 [Uloborus diversus]|uniref:uncharacterized protein LOC129230315 n=1 Tax=Uloborus diversus TaxID=327109 RepID=UPI00240A78D6|nr:uncharacterized protein LOC129230315 [Uloborus diversus]